MSEIAKKEREWGIRIDALLAAGDMVGYWSTYRDYLLWCKQTSRGYISPMRTRMLMAIDRTIEGYRKGV